MIEARPNRPQKGRGAVSNRSGRYEAYRHIPTFDGWEQDAEDGAEARPATSVARDSSRRVIARNQSPDVPFDRSINPYRGCEHGCIYCFARPTHAWLGLSPGLDFETRLFAKPDAAELLRAELARPSYRPSTLALGTATDPYQPVERRLEITRSLLAVLKETRHPVAIVTKSPLVTRDLDLLAPMAALGMVRVLVSVTTLDPALARRLEPRAPAAKRRIAAIASLAEAGVPVGVLAAPMIPALNDAELERILEAAAAAGARTAGYVLLRLPLEIKELFEEWLEAHYPDRKAKVLKLVRETRGGRLYESQWGVRMRGRGVYAELLEQRFRQACRRSGLDRGEWALDETRFRHPAPKGDPAQMSLF
jgi:DNA repair photolyase